MATTRKTTDLIVVHTAAATVASAADIDRWHRERGWDGIGYHFVIRKDGTLERGRALHLVGAHARGVNGRSVAIVVEGHGDRQPHTAAQRRKLAALGAAMCTLFELDPSAVRGHNEAVTTDKTCPGRKVNMDRVRTDVAVMLLAMDEASGMLP